MDLRPITAGAGIPPDLGTLIAIAIASLTLLATVLGVMLWAMLRYMEGESPAAEIRTGLRSIMDRAPLGRASSARRADGATDARRRLVPRVLRRRPPVGPALYRPGGRVQRPSSR